MRYLIQSNQTIHFSKYLISLGSYIVLEVQINHHPNSSASNDLQTTKGLQGREKLNDFLCILSLSIILPTLFLTDC